MLMRLDKFLADCGVGTRSQVKDYIRKKRISVNGTTDVKPETKIDTDVDVCLVDNEPIGFVEYEYYMLNKPAGVISATEDKYDKTVIDLIPELKKDSFPVGRLDKDTEGLLLITNDGELAHRLLSPKKHVDKTYYAVVEGYIDAAVVRKFADGLQVDSTFTAMPAKLEILGYDDRTDYVEDSVVAHKYLDDVVHAMESHSDSREHITDMQHEYVTTSVYITIHEGKFHQIKRMFEAVSSRVLYLKRVSMGPLVLDERLAPGEYRQLTSDEIKALNASGSKFS